MNPVRSFGLLTICAVLGACATQAPAPEPKAAAPVAAPKPAPVAKSKPSRGHSALSMRSGTYKCDLDRRVVVRSVSADQSLAVLNWNKRDYQLKAVSTASGALRYEDQGSGLTWITIVGKSMLLDTRQGKQLANDCKV